MMKRLIIFTGICLIFATATFAQKGSVTSAEYALQDPQPADLKKAKAKIDAAVLHEKTKDWPQTYIIKAKVYSALFEESRKKDEKNPDSKLAQAVFDAIMKAEELDIKGDAKGKKKLKYQKEIGVYVTTSVRFTVLNDAIAAYNRSDYKGAGTGFQNVLALDKMQAVINASEPAVFSMDTAILFNAAIAAYYDKRHEKAVELLQKTMDYGYGGKNPYLMLYTEYRDLQDTVNMVKTLKAGFDNYPDEKIFINDLVVYYINSGQIEEGMDYINKALEGDPDNTSFWFAKGSFLDQKGSIEEALECYKVVMERSTNDDNIYNANYNAGVIYYNKAVALVDSANLVPNNQYNLYKEKLVLANDAFKVVVPYFEKCVEIKPDDKATMVNLNGVYYRLIKEDGFRDKYESLKAKIDAL